jgi:hypothetical protein
VQEKGLHVKEPQRRAEEQTDREREQLRRAFVVEGSEGGESESSEISENAKGGDRYSGDFSISAAEDLEAPGLSAASGSYSCESQDGEVSSVRQTGEAEQTGDRVKDNPGA